MHRTESLACIMAKVLLKTKHESIYRKWWPKCSSQKLIFVCSTFTATQWKGKISYTFRKGTVRRLGHNWQKCIEYILVSNIAREVKGKDGELFAGDVQKGTQTCDGCTERHTDMRRIYRKAHSHATDVRRSTQLFYRCTERQTDSTHVRKVAQTSDGCTEKHANIQQMYGELHTSCGYT
jgi:hypothetical protein